MEEDKRAKAFGDSAGRGLQSTLSKQPAGRGGDGAQKSAPEQSRETGCDSKNKHVWKTSESHEGEAHVPAPQR